MLAVSGLVCTFLTKDTYVDDKQIPVATVLTSLLQWATFEAISQSGHHWNAHQRVFPPTNLAAPNHFVKFFVLFSILPCIMPCLHHCWPTSGCASGGSRPNQFCAGYSYFTALSNSRQQQKIGFLLLLPRLSVLCVRRSERGIFNGQICQIGRSSYWKYRYFFKGKGGF